MDGLRFDRIARLWGSRSSRRRSLRALGGAALGAALGALGVRGARGDGAGFGPLALCGLTCPAGQVCTGGDFGEGEVAVGPDTCCAPERVFRTGEVGRDAYFCCPADQVCPDTTGDFAWDAQCCFAGRPCIDGECCGGGASLGAEEVCGQTCCRGGSCQNGVCVCESGVSCDGECCRPSLDESFPGPPFCGVDYAGFSVCCYAEGGVSGAPVLCLGHRRNPQAAGGGLGRIRP